MRVRRMLLALLACVALGVVAANSAQAALHWNINGSQLVGSESVNVSGGPWSLVGETLGIKVELTAEEVECASTCAIEGEGKSKGTLKFKGVKVVKPANCTAGNPLSPVGSITTKALKGQVIMDPSHGAGPVFDQFTPEGANFVEIEFHGEFCTLNEQHPAVEGSAGGESPNQTSFEASPKSLTFGSTQQTTSSSALSLGGGSVALSGTANFTLKGGNAGKTFSAGTLPLWSSTKMYGVGEEVEWKGACYKAKNINTNSEPANANWTPTMCP